MSYPNNMTKKTLDSLIKAYADSISTFKQQEKIKPLDLVLPGIDSIEGFNSIFGPTSVVSFAANAGDSLGFGQEKYTTEHSVITSNGIIPSGFDTIQSGMSPPDPLRQSLGCFWVTNSDSGPSYARSQLSLDAKKMGQEYADDQNYFYEPQNPDEFDTSYDYIYDNNLLAGAGFSEGYTFKSGVDDLAKLFSAKYSYDSIYKPNILYRTAPTYFKTGIEHFEFTQPEMYGPGQTFDFKTPLFDLGFNQYIKIHYNFSKAASVASKETNTLRGPDHMKQVLPLSMFCGLEERNEGIKVYYQKDDLVNEKTVFFPDTSSPTNWEAPFPFKDYFFDPQGETEEAETQNKLVASAILQKAFGTDSPNYYEDHSFYSRAAMSAEVTKIFGEEQNQNDAIADVVPYYNFTSPFWEKALSKFQLFPNAGPYSDFNKELAIGNIYAYCFNKKEEENIKFEFNNYGNKLMYCALDQADLDTFRYSNLFFLTPMKEFNTKVDDIKYQFPMYNEITFKSETVGQLGVLLKESGMNLEFFSTLLSYIYHETAPWNSLTLDELNAILADYQVLESKGILKSGMISQGKVTTNNRSIATKMKKPSILGSKPESFSLSHGPIGDYDFDAWMQSYVQYLDNPSENWSPSKSLNHLKRKVKFFGLETEELENALEDFNPKKVFGLVKFMQKFQEIVSLKTRPIHDIFSADKSRNKMAYSETIMYRIEKVDQSTNLTMQNIFVPLDQAQDTIKYIDTQVRYGRPYIYRIYAIKMVIGTEYKYDPFLAIGDSPENNRLTAVANRTPIPGDSSEKYGDLDLELYDIFAGVATGGVNSVPVFSGNNQRRLGKSVENIGLSVIEIKYRPSVKVIEVPYHEERFVTLVDNPPMPPLTNIYPLSGQKNKLLLTFENQTGDRNLTPVSIGATNDANLFDLHRVVQKRSLKLPDGELYDPTIRFKSDDTALYYQIFKIAYKKPLNYTDFSDSLVATVSMENLQGGYEDRIATNVKYYYTFRTVDRHGNISNPTPVYEVEMVEDSGVTYPIIKVLDDFEKSKNYVYSKPFRRYMMVDAADQHVGLNEEKTGIVDDETALTGKDPVLGIANKSLWNDKRFKFRIKSKQTGKTIDLNLQFKTRHITDGNENTNLCD